jgi:serine/threonine-protein kinase
MARPEHAPTEPVTPATDVTLAAPSERTGALVAGRYRLLRRIGQGGMGAVYEAEVVDAAAAPAGPADPPRRVALKLLARGLSQDREALARFQREARLAAAIGHPGIVRVLDNGTSSEGEPFLVMELCPGRPLEALLQSQPPMPLGRLLDLLDQTLAALTAAHAQGIIHRDIKPDNLLVTESAAGDRVTVVDFGVSRVVSPLSRSTKLTRSGEMIGTPRYMSPEQARGHEPVGAGTDLFAVGVILYRALSGRFPFPARDLFELMAALARDAPRPLIKAAPETPAELAEVVDRAVARDAADRFASAAEMRAALAALPPALRVLPLVPRAIAEAATTGGPGATSSLGKLALEALEQRSAALQQTSAPAAPEQPPPPPAATPRRWWPWALGLSGSAAALTLAGVLVLGLPRPPAPAPATTSAPASETATAPMLAPALPPSRQPADSHAGTPAPDAATARARKPERPTVIRGPEVITRSRVFVTPGRKEWPVDYDPRRFDGLAYLAGATRRAREFLPDAQLFALEVNGVSQAGLADLTDPETRQALYRFRSPTASKLGPDDVAGAPRPCQVYVEASGENVGAYVVRDSDCDPRLVRLPSCSMTEVLALAHARGAPRRPARFRVTYKHEARWGDLFTVDIGTFSAGWQVGCR